MGEFESRSVKTRDAVEGFHMLKNSHKLYQGFPQAMGARTACFISFIKLLFSLLTKRKTLYKVLTVNSHNVTISLYSLSNAGIVNLDGKILQQLTSLEELNLSKNKLSKLEIRDFVIVPSLKVLDLSQNQLTCVDGLISFPNLESLVLLENSKLEVKMRHKLHLFCLIIVITNELISWIKVS